MKLRRLAPLALVAAVLIGTSGCSMISNIATTIEYPPGEGINASSGGLDIRNALVVSDDGVDGNFVAAIVNDTAETKTLVIEAADGAIRETIRVPANTVISLGVNEEPVLLEGIDTPAGATMPIYFQSGDGAGDLTTVPVLDGTLPYFADLVP